jgi:hypothetical protein
VDRLLQELTGSSILDQTGADWASAYQAERGVPLDTALLELDLVDEEDLLRSLEACWKIDAASAEDVTTADPAVSRHLPRSLSKSFLMCPVRRAGEAVVALVESPLPPEWVQELSDLFGLKVQERVAPNHYLELARELVYGIAAREGARDLEFRLERRRRGPRVGAVAESVRRSPALAPAVAHVLRFAQERFDFACFLVQDEGAMQVIEFRAAEAVRTVPLPDTSCALGPAILHGGYFLGPIRDTVDNRQFYEALGRPLPRAAFMAPVPVAQDTRVMLCGDNGSRGIAARWAAELTLLTSRLGACQGSWSALRSAHIRREQRDAEHASAAARTDRETSAAERDSGALAESSAAPAAVPPASDASGSVAGSPMDGAALPGPAASEPTSAAACAPTDLPEVTVAERTVLERLKRAADEAGMGLEAFVDDLLRPGPAKAAAPNIATELKGLFEKLATDIPTHMARGMEAAFRDRVPRLAVAGPAPASAERAPAAIAKLEMVRKEAGPREVADYRSRRKRAAPVKL